MTTSSSDLQHSLSSKKFFFSLMLLWLAGAGLRLTILAPPPVIHLIHADLNMTETQIGLLSGIPALLFAAAAILGALLVARFGALNAIIIGLLTTAVGSALRGAVPNVELLYVTTVITGLGVAIMQPSMPALVRAWLPRHIGLATAVYINGLLIGEVLPVSFTHSVILPLVGNWRINFVVWGAVCAVIALIIFMFAPRPITAMPKTVPLKWWPNWRSGLIWKLGIMMGSVNAIYFATNFFIPRYLQEAGRASDISASLMALNIGQLPASILLLFVVRGLERQAWVYIACGILCLLAILSIVFGNTMVTIAGAGLLGFAAATVLILMLSLPPLLSPAEDVHRTAAAMITIGYSCAVIIPIFSGLTWDLTGVSTLVFVPIGLSAFMLILPAITLRINSTQNLTQCAPLRVRNFLKR